MERYTGARILVEALIEEGVDTVFGYPGGAALFIYDELYRQRGRIRHVLVSHEQHAAHAADGYARASGKPGVCIATSGPGATNLVTGIATAMMDSSPLVAITCNVATPLLGKDSFQEVDIAGITMPIVKHNWIVKDVSELGEIVREAFIVARSGRPGPVLIDIPKDVTAQSGKWVALEQICDGVLGARSLRLDTKSKRQSWTDVDIERAVDLISAARCPAIYAGGGLIISGACDELVRFAEYIRAPVALSLMGIGAFPREHPLCTGLLGMHGTVASNKVVQNADLLIAIGARFSDRVTSDVHTFAENANILHFDIDPAEINKNVPVKASVIGNIRETLKLVIKGLQEKAKPRDESFSKVWLDRVEGWKQEVPASHQEYRDLGGLHPRFIIEETEARLANLGKGLTAVTDVGQHQMWTAQFFKVSKPRCFLTSGGLGTMGFGLGASIGAKFARPQDPLVLFTGDGSFRMNCGELATLAAYKLPVLVVICNNGVLGMVRQWQTLFYEGRYSETTLDRPPDFIKLAEAYSVASFRACTEEAFLGALDGACAELVAGRPALIDAVIDCDEKVLPMVPGGKPIHEQIL